MNSSNKTFIIVIVLVVIIAGGYFLLSSEKIQTPAEEISNSLGMPVPGKNTPEMIAIEEENTNKSPVAGQSITASVVTYSNTGYSPGLLTIKLGDTVTFKNNSSLSMWTASGFHPTHKSYPTTGGCLGSTFDACKGVLPGDSWSFKFDIAGSWKYHDHLKPSFFGTIVVE